MCTFCIFIWTTGNGPNYLSSPSCLLLSRTIITVGCNQLHSYICEIGTFSVHSISPTSSKAYAIRDTFVSTTTDHSPQDVSRLKTSFTHRPGTSTTAIEGSIIQESLSSSEMMCYRFCLSQNPSEVDKTNLNTPKPHTDEIKFLNDSLKINVKETSKAIRKLTSAWDSRKSSKTIGAFAIAIISAVLLCVMLMDLPLLIKHYKCFLSKLKFLQKW